MSEQRTKPQEGFAEVEFNSEPFLTDFKKIYADMHNSGCPFAHSSSGDHYAVGSHSKIMEILKQYDVWKAKYGPGLNYLESPGVLVSVDPPEHTFEVRIVSSSFSREVFDAMAPDMEAFVNEQIDKVYEQGEADLHDLISIQLPLFVIFRLLGFDRYDEDGTDRFDWVREGIIASVGLMLVPPEEAAAMIDSGNIEKVRMQALSRTSELFSKQLAEAKAKLDSGEWQGEENLVTRFLTTPGPDGSFLSDDKILGFMGFLLTAGSATTTIMISNIIYRLLTEEGAWDKVFNNRELIPLAIEETLRLDAPVHGLFRTNDEEVELGGVKVEKDTKVMLLWAAGNLDPEIFDDPMKFDLDRDLAKVRRHLAFGYGTHFCRGAPLARLEGDVVLRIIFERLKNLRLNGEVEMEKRMPVLQGIRKLPVAWDV
ncbi:MAG: cytochrome P450 [Pseudomonadales bacterium]|nr:cytochrome P450 [Pseudomonadales bacterium]